jgi:ABC-2 type transport system ATP-binding protein
LVSDKNVILFDEPVLGFDAIMRMQFYDLLTKSFHKHPRIIIVSTHIIEEIAKTIHKLIIIDKGKVRFFDTLQSVESKAFSVSGLRNDVEAATRGLTVIGQDTVGGLVTTYIFDNPPQQSGSVEIHHLSLEEFFVQMVMHQGDLTR